MHVCEYLNQIVTRIGENNGKSFKGASKTKKKKHMKRFSFIDQFKIFYFCLLVVDKYLEKWLEMES